MNKGNNSVNYITIRNPSVVDSVKDWIIDQMIRGVLRPGSKLPTESELCENLKASRNSVREAIKQLEAYGVVYIKRAEGTFVSESFEPKMLSPVLYSLILSSSNWEDFVDLRRAIDIGTLFVLLGKKLTKEDLNCLRQALAELDSTVQSQDLSVVRITEADCNFHNVIIELANNMQLKTMYNYINRITVPSREKTTEMVIKNGEIESYMHLHHQLYDLIENGDKTKIEQTVLDHYVFWEKYSE